MEVREFIKMIDKMLENPPMRGDVALSDLRNLVEEKEKERLLDLVSKQYAEAWVKSVGVVNVPERFRDIGNAE
jgi:hypothetical protein